MSAFAFACPHCGRPGIPVAAKVVSAGAMFWGWSATCRLCRQRARLSGTAVNVQFGILVAALASVPWLPETDTRIAAGYIAAAAILAVGMVAPMSKDLTS